MGIVKEVMDLGLGIMVLTREKTEKIVDELVKRGKLKKNEGKGLVEELIKRGRAEQKDFEKRLSKIISQAYSKLDIATKDDVKKLEKEIKKIKARKR